MAAKKGGQVARKERYHQFRVAALNIDVRFDTRTVEAGILHFPKTHRRLVKHKGHIDKIAQVQPRGCFLLQCPDTVPKMVLQQFI